MQWDMSQLGELTLALTPLSQPVVHPAASLGVGLLCHAARLPYVLTLGMCMGCDMILALLAGAPVTVLRVSRNDFLDVFRLELLLTVRPTALQRLHCVDAGDVWPDLG